MHLGSISRILSLYLRFLEMHLESESISWIVGSARGGNLGTTIRPHPRSHLPPMHHFVIKSFDFFFVEMFSFVFES